MPPQEFEVQLVTQSDLPVVAQFEADHFDMGQPYSLSDYEKFFELGYIVQLVSNRSKELLGVALVAYGKEANDHIFIESDEGYLAGIVIHKNHRQRGLAKPLLQERERLSKERGGIRHLKTCIRPSNEPSLKYITRSGYRVEEGMTDIMPVDEATGDQGHRLILGKDLEPTPTSNAHTEQQEIVLRGADEREVCDLINQFKGRILGSSITSEGKLLLTLHS